MRGYEEINLNWSEDGTYLLSVTVGGELIEPEEFGELLFSQDETIEESIIRLESCLECILSDEEEFYLLLEIITTRMRKIKKDHC